MCAFFAKMWSPTLAQATRVDQTVPNFIEGRVVL